MINRRKKLNYLSVIAYLFLLFGFLCFNKLRGNVSPFSIGLYVGALSVEGSLIITSILFLLSFLLQGETGLLASMGIVAIFYIIISLIYRKSKSKMRLTFSLFTAIAMVGYIFLGNTLKNVSIQTRLIESAFCVVLSYICSLSLNAFLEKGLKYKFATDEYACILSFTIIFGVGLSHFTTPLLWKGISAFLVLLISYLFKFGVSTTISAVLGITLSIYYGNITIISVFICWGILCGFLMKASRYASALCLPLVDLLIQIVFSVYNSYSTIDFMPIIIASLLFCIIPSKTLSYLKDKLYLFREKQLVRQTINRNKKMLSNKLYELSGAFTEMNNAFKTLKKAEMSGEMAKTLISKQTIEQVCEGCNKNKKCQCDIKAKNDAICKLVDIGFAKGRITLIDMPKSISDICSRPSDLLYCINKLLADYRRYCLEKQNASIGRDLLAEEAEGVAEILRGLALETGTQLSFQSDLERTLSQNLFKSGFNVSELLIYGENHNISVSLILTMREFSLTTLQSVINKTLGFNLLLCDKNTITDDKVYLAFKKQAPFDAVFGVAKAVKQGSQKSGDTHSVTKIDGDKFLVALSDGMGSGDDAEKISTVALSLIESFYKAGLSSNLILNTVNKILSINADDNFTALDISVIDLKTCQADFIKYGSPYGFILGEKGIKIIEGNSLPLGILEELKPSVCHADLINESMLLFVTDGISDAFGSADEIITYLRNAPKLNPQNLADDLLNTALQLSNNCPQDDMTVVAVRLFKKQSA